MGLTRMGCGRLQACAETAGGGKDVFFIKCLHRVRVVYSERTSRAILVIAYGFIQSVTVFRSVTAQLTVISVWFYVSIFSSFQFVTFIISLGV